MKEMKVGIVRNLSMGRCLEWDAVNSRVLVHGNAKGKQGDPFSAFLFTFVADVLSGRMIKLEESGLLEGFIVGRDRTRGVSFTILDDTIFFSKVSLENMQNLEVEFEGLNGGTWVLVTERSRDFVVSIGFDMEELDWLMEHLKKAVEVEASREFVTKRKPLVLVVPEGVKGKGWEDLRKAILSVQEYYERDGGASKEKNEAGLRTGGTWSAGKWARAVICESQEEVHDWTHVGRAIARMMGMKGMVSIHAISAFKDASFLVEFHFEEMGRVTKVAKETLKLVDLTRAKLWVEMLPNVVLPALLEVEDGEWSYTVAVSVAGEDEDVDAVTSEVNRSRNEWVRVGGCVSQSSKDAEGYEVALRTLSATERGVFPRARYRQSRTCLADKGETGGGWSRSGQAEAIFIGPEHESSFKAQQVRAQSGMSIVGFKMAQMSLETTSLHRLRPFLPSELLLLQGDRDALSRRSKGWRRVQKPVGVGPKIRRIEALWYGSQVAEEEIEARKGKSPRGLHERCYAGGRNDNFKEDVVYPLPSKRRSTTGHRCCSEPFFTRGSSSSSEDRNMVEEFGMGFQMDRGIRVNPLSRCHLSGKLSKEDTSASRVEVQGGLSGRVGFDPRGYSDMGSPSNSIIRPPESPSIPSCSPDSPLKNPSGPILPNLVSLPHPDHVEEENQCALSNQMSESCTPKDSIVSHTRKFRVISLLMACPPGKWPKCESCNVRGLGSRNKRRMIKDFLRSENPDVVMIQETKKENCDRRFVGSVWTVRNKDWVALPASGASGGILIIWDSKVLSREEVVIGSFSGLSQVLFGRLWTPLDFCCLWSK
ncbi:hypothetical protein CK203_023560 [Vitis vinifera]|uniref:DUF4283 domain-containing protein n=1 Tax=Vitis vinifera TaxID=29760 RepID=A0A438JBT8_VITVI|nr:hypothetical protein CK203_023560 [Vitis vinifera]